MSTSVQLNPSTNADKLNTVSTILDLQQLEKQLFTNLETLSANNTDASLAEQGQIINKINDLCGINTLTSLAGRLHPHRTHTFKNLKGFASPMLSVMTLTLNKKARLPDPLNKVQI